MKRLAEIASQRYGLEMPFVSKRFRTDGQKVFLELYTKLDAAPEPAKLRENGR